MCMSVSSRRVYCLVVQWCTGTRQQAWCFSSVRMPPAQLYKDVNFLCEQCHQLYEVALG